MAKEAPKKASAFGGAPAINASQSNVHPLSPVDKATPTPLKGEEKIEPFGTRLPRSFQKRIKRTALDRDVSVQEAAYEAFHMWMETPHPNDNK